MAGLFDSLPQAAPEPYKGLFAGLPDVQRQAEGSFVPEAGKAFAAGAVETTAAAMKGLSATTTVANIREFEENSQKLELYRRIDAGEPVEDIIADVPRRIALDAKIYANRGETGRKPLREAAEGFVRVFEESAKTPITEAPLFKAGQATQNWSQEQFAAAQDYEKSWTRAVVSGLGSLVPTIGAYLAGGPSGAMVAGYGMSGGEAIDRAIKAGAKPEEIIRVVKLGGLPGLTEQVPIETLFAKIPLPGWGKAAQVLVKILTQAAVEGGQEGVQQVGQNLIEKYVYDPDQDITEGMVEAAGIGALVGGTAATVTPQTYMAEAAEARPGAQPPPPPAGAPEGVPAGAEPAATVIPDVTMIPEEEAPPAPDIRAKMVVNDPPFTANDGTEYPAGELHGQTVRVEQAGDNMSIIETADGQRRKIGNNLLQEPVATPEAVPSEPVAAPAPPSPLPPEETAVVRALPEQAAEAAKLPDSPRLTPDDRKSPIPNELIDSGKAIVESATGQPSTFTTTTEIDGRRTVVTGNVSDLVAENRAETQQLIARITAGVPTPEILAPAPQAAPPAGAAAVPALPTPPAAAALPEPAVAAPAPEAELALSAAPPGTPPAPSVTTPAAGKQTYRTDWRGEVQGQFDPQYYDVVEDTLTDDAGKVIATKDKLVAKPGLVDRVPATAEPGVIYRGISADDYANIQRTGQIASSGDYNMSSQAGLTYYGTDPQIAESYANSFAPAQYKPTFDKPAYVIAVRRPPDSRIRHVEGVGENEVGVVGSLPASDIVAVYRGDVAAYNPGVRPTDPRGGGITIAPSARLHWQKVDTKPLKPLEKFGAPGSQARTLEEARRAAPEPVTVGEVEVRHPDYETFEAYIDGKKVGELNISPQGPHASSVTVQPGAQRKGVATALYDAAEKALGRRMTPSPMGLSDQAISFWKNRLAKLKPAERQALLQEALDRGIAQKIGKSARARVEALGYVEPGEEPMLKAEPRPPAAPQAAKGEVAARVTPAKPAAAPEPSAAPAEPAAQAALKAKIRARREAKPGRIIVFPGVKERFLRKLQAVKAELQGVIMSFDGIAEALAKMASIPPTDLENGSGPYAEFGAYNSPEWWQRRVYNFGTPDKPVNVRGLEEAVPLLVERARNLAVEELNEDRAKAGQPLLKHYTPAQDRKATIVIGPPAAGKSTIANAIALKQKAAIADVDDAKKVIPEYYDPETGKGGIGANAVHEESSYLGTRVLERLIAAGDNLIIPKIGDNPAKMERLREELQKMGYTVDIVLMDVEPKTALTRMLKRFRNTGRLVNPEYFVGVAPKPARTYSTTKGGGNFDGYARVVSRDDGRPARVSEAFGREPSLALGQELERDGTIGPHRGHAPRPAEQAARAPPGTARGQVGPPSPTEEPLLQTLPIREGREAPESLGLPRQRLVGRALKKLRYTTRQVAAALQARQRDRFGTIERDDRSGAAKEAIAEWMADEVEFEMHPDRRERSGNGWYGEKFQKALDALGTRFPELIGSDRLMSELPGLQRLKTKKNARDFLTAIIAVTSDGEKVTQNWVYAARAYAAFREQGSIPDDARFYRGAVALNLQNINRLLDQYGPVRMHKFLMQERTVSELKQDAKAAGIELSTKYQAHIRMPLAALVFGPKLGAFYANLMGAHGYLTMDRWWSRTFNRYRGQLLTRVRGTAEKPTDKQGNRIGLARFKEIIGQPNLSDEEALAEAFHQSKLYEEKGFKNGTEAETAGNTIKKDALGTEDTPFGATDRSFMIDTANRALHKLAGRGINTNLANVQAILWYYEKRLYSELGARETADVSYEDVARRVAEGSVEDTGPAGPAAPDAVEGPDGASFSIGATKRDQAAGREADAQEVTGAFRIVETTPSGTVTTFELTPEFVDRARDVLKTLRAELDRLGLSDVPLRVGETIEAIVQGRRIEAGGRFFRNIIDVALSSADVVETLHHEAVHALKKLGLFGRTEWAILERLSKSKWMADHNIKELYAGFSEEKQIEEGIVAAYVDWRNGKKFDPLVVRAFKRIQSFFTALRNALQGNGFTSAESIFRSIERGEIGGRPRRGDAANPVDAKGTPLFQSVWHGSKAVFDRFSTAFMNTGEGSQAFGWGLYFGSIREVAEHYREKVSGGEKGVVYKVSIPEDSELMVWDKPLAEQPKGVQEKLRSVMGKQLSDDMQKHFEKQWDGLKGFHLYERLAVKLGKPGASAALKAAGIPGHKYLDEGSRAAGKGTHNYVIYDDAAIEIEAMFSLTGPPSSAQQAQQMMQGFIARGQPIDRAMRFTFDLLGGLDEQNNWRPGKRLSDRLGPQRREGAAIGGIVGAGVGTIFGGPVGGAIGGLAGATAGGYILGSSPRPTDGRFGWFAGMAENAKRGLISNYGLDPEYVEAYRKSELGKTQILRQAQGIMKVLSNAGVGTTEAKVLQSILTGKPVNDAEMTRLAVPIRQAIDDLGAEAVSLGLISAESFERNRGAYLHRVYAKHEVPTNALAGWVSQKMAARRKRIIGDQLKGRGIFWEVEIERLMKDAPNRPLPGKGDKWRVIDRVSPDGKVSRRVYVPADKPTPNEFTFPGWVDRGEWEVRQVQGVAPVASAKKAGPQAPSGVTLWRDYTEAERGQMGEIIDSRYTIAKTFMMMANDLATGRFFKEVAGRAEWSTDVEPAAPWKDANEYGRFWTDPEIQWVKVPDSAIPKSGGKKTWGALAGKWVRSEIWRDLNEVQIAGNPGTWRKLYAQWKRNKTARNPVVHMNNVMSNMMFMDMADIRLQDLVGGLNAFFRGNSDFQEALDNGAFGGDIVAQELRQEVLQPILDEISRQQGTGVSAFLARAGVAGIVADKLWTWAKYADERMLKAYQAEDEIFRMAAYMRRRSQGATPAEAAREARDQFLNYDIRAPWVVLMRNSLLPFISYTYRAVPKLMENVMHRPWKFAKYAAVAYAVNALAYMLDDWDDEDKEKEGETRERAALRKEEQGATWLGTPRMVRMPWRDDNGLPVFLDVRRWVPAGDVFDSAQGTSAIPIPAPLHFGGPIQIAFELMMNRSAFTGEDITNELTDEPLDRVSNVADFLWKSWAPASFWTPRSWYWTKISNALYGATDVAGHPYSLPQALLSSIGIKLKPVDVEDGIKWHFLDYRKTMMELKSQLRSNARRLDRGLISQSAHDDEAADLMRKFETLGANLEEFSERTRKKRQPEKVQ